MDTFDELLKELDLNKEQVPYLENLLTTIVCLRTFTVILPESCKEYVNGIYFATDKIIETLAEIVTSAKNKEE